MPLTVDHLCAVPSLHVRMLTPTAPRDGEFRWVHNSDLLDPTPFLGGPLMLLTTGRQFTRSGGRTQYESYVDRLILSGVCALGFGSEVVRPGIPRELVEVCENRGLPLVEVPYLTPFIAIIQWAAEQLSEEAHSREAWALSAGRAVSLAALGSPDLGGALAVLAAQLQRSVILFSADGAVVTRIGTERLTVEDEEQLLVEASRLLARGNRASSTITRDPLISTLQTLGRRSHLSGVLAISGSTELDGAASLVVTGAVALVEVSLERTRPVRSALRALKSQLLRLLLDGHTSAAENVLIELGESLPAWPLVVAVVAESPSPDNESPSSVEIPGSADATRELLESRATRALGAHLLAVLDSRIVLLVAPGRMAALQTLANQLGLSIGTSEPATPDTLKGALVQAVRAAERSGRRGTPGVVQAGSPEDGVFGLLSRDGVGQLAALKLAPALADENGPELLACARVWLDHNGVWDAAARQLGIHRHSLRLRISQLELLLGTPLTSFESRAELWALISASGLTDESSPTL